MAVLQDGMGSLSQAKTLGGIGSILVILSVVPGTFGILGIVGFVLTLIAVKYISDSLQDASIFKNILIAVILGIVGTVVGVVVIFASLFSFMGLASGASSSSAPGLLGLLTGVVAGLIAIWAVSIVSAYFLRKGYDVVSSRLNVGMFRTAALLYLIGAVLVVVLIGFLLIFVAEILFIVAFFSIPEVPSVSSAVGVTTTTPPPAPQGAQNSTKFCTKCGTSLSSDSEFCSNCGTSQTT